MCLTHLSNYSGKESVQASLSHVLGSIEFNTGNMEQAKQYFIEALSLARQGDDNKVLTGILVSFGGVLGTMGEFEEAAQYLQEALPHAERSNDQRRLSDLLLNLGVLNQRLGKLVDAKLFLSRGLTTAESIEYYEREILFLDTIGVILSQQGNWDEAITYQEKALEIATRLDQKDLISHVHANLSEAYIQLGEYMRARINVRKGLHVARSVPIPWNEAELLVRSASIARLQSRWARAGAILNAAEVLANKIGDPALTSTVLNEYGEFYLQQVGSKDLAQEKFTAALAISENELLDQWAEALYGLARISVQDGNLSQAYALGSRALGVAQSFNSYRATEIKEWLTHLSR